MQTKEDVIKRFEKRIEGLRDTMICNICDIQETINEMDKSLNMISYLSYLKEELIKNEEV